jgi:hypothetical protein
MANVEKDNCQIDADKRIASTSTPPFRNSEVCLISSFKENIWITDSGCSHHMTGDNQNSKS